MMKKLMSVLIILTALMMLSGCSDSYGPAGGYYDADLNEGMPTNNETYDEIIENDFVSASKKPLSTFSTDVDTASYSNIRRILNEGSLPSKNAVRIEEMINYFSYDFEGPTETEDIRVYQEMGKSPWHDEHQLLMIGLKTEEIQFDESKSMNLVFLIDVSGSMQSSDKLPLLKKALRTLVENLRPQDKISLVIYASDTRVVLEGGDASDKEAILKAIDRLEAGGSTSGGSGIKLAYQVAKRQFIEGGNNRIILASDGDFNVGVSSPEELKNLVSEEKESGVFLSVLGFGTGNYRDDMMSSIAQNGNGVYYYIDTLQEAEKVLVHELGATMNTVAKDVKIQIEFNPSLVKGYRLLGYENRLLNNEDFLDDTKDAGDLGSGHVTIAYYEIIPVGATTVIKDNEEETTEPLKYDGSNYQNEYAHISIRYKHPSSDTSKKIDSVVLNTHLLETNTRDFRFSSSVVMFGLLLRDSKYKGTSSYQKVITRAEEAISSDPYGYEAEFVELVKIANRLAD